MVFATSACVPAPVPPLDGGDDVVDSDDGLPQAGLPLTTFRTTHFSGAGLCAACHGGLVDESGADVSVATEWRATMLANAALDPFFLASLASEIEHAPHLSETIEDICAKCHTPMARTQAVADGTEVRMLGNGFLNSEHALFDAATDGVSCSLCHQVRDTFLDDPESSFSGGYDIDMSTEKPDRIEYGPFPGPQQPDVMQGAVGFVPTHGEHVGDSGLCATCHTLFTPTLDADGTIVGSFPEQTPFLEWQHSVFGDPENTQWNCQSCHMPAAVGGVVITQVPAFLNAREPFYRHAFLSGNVFMLRLMRNNVTRLGLHASSEQFEASAMMAEAFLQNETANLAIQSAAVDGDALVIQLVVTNRTGHKFPTGFPSRRAWIHLRVEDANGATLFESGSFHADGTIVGDASDASKSFFEPHYGEITDDGQVQIYQSVMADTDGNVTYLLLRAAAYAKDNRLLPDGFDKTTADVNVAVIGQAEADADFVGGSDGITYRVAVGDAAGPLSVTAELLYQSVAPPFVEALRADNDPLIDSFVEMYDAADKTPTVVASVSVNVP